MADNNKHCESNNTSKSVANIKKVHGEVPAIKFSTPPPPPVKKK